MIARLRGLRERLSVPRADEHGLGWEMFWPCVVLAGIGAAGLGYGFAPLIWGAS